MTDNERVQRMSRTLSMALDLDRLEREGLDTTTISIHALLAESDLGKQYLGQKDEPISIHALLAESDFSSVSTC